MDVQLEDFGLLSVTVIFLCAIEEVLVVHHLQLPLVMVVVNVMHFVRDVMNIVDVMSLVIVAVENASMDRP